jgi:hypothetical protein
MFGSPNRSNDTDAPPTQPTTSTTPSTSLLQSVSAAPQRYQRARPTRATAHPRRAPPPQQPVKRQQTIHPSTNPASFRSLLGSHRAVVAMFTSATCAPCRMIEPVFEELARTKTGAPGAGRVCQGRFGCWDGFYGRARAWCCCDADVWVFLGWEEGACVVGLVLTFLLRSGFACRFMN